MNKKYLFSGFLSAGFFWAGITKAICPLCVIAVGAGLGFSRWLGVDDVVSSIWIGALLVSVSMWTLFEMKKKNWSFPFAPIAVFLGYYLLTFIPLYMAGIVGHPYNRIFGMDKIVFGTVVGTVMFALSSLLHGFLKKKNNGKSFFPYQKVAVPVVVLLLTSAIFFALISWRII